MDRLIAGVLALALITPAHAGEYDIPANTPDGAIAITHAVIGHCLVPRVQQTQDVSEAVLILDGLYILIEASGPEINESKVNKFLNLINNHVKQSGAGGFCHQWRPFFESLVEFNRKTHPDGIAGNRAFFLAHPEELKGFMEKDQ